MTEKPVDPAATEPCAHCPWRTSNHGKPTKDKFYTLANLRRLWAGLRRGERMTCHPTDIRMNEFESAPRVKEGATARECAGALVLQQRELQRVQNACYEVEEMARWGKAPSALALYRATHPKGLTREGAAVLTERFIFGGTALGGMKMTRVDLMAPCSHPDLRPFDLSEVRSRE